MFQEFVSVFAEFFFWLFISALVHGDNDEEKAAQIFIIPYGELQSIFVVFFHDSTLEIKCHMRERVPQSECIK